MRTQLVILVGPPGTGKSHYAYKLAKKNPNQWVVVSRDGIRRSLGDKSKFSKFNLEREELLSSIEFDTIVTSLSSGFSVIADISHISYKGQFDGIPDIICPYNVSIQIKYFKCSIWLATLRDVWRGIKGGHMVGSKRIKQLHNQFYIPNDYRNDYSLINHKQWKSLKTQ